MSLFSIGISRTSLLAITIVASLSIAAIGEEPKPLVCDPDVARFVMILGRVHIDPESFKVTQLSRTDPNTGRELDVCLTLVKRTPCLRIRASSAQESFRLELDHDGCMKIESFDKANDIQVSLYQPTVIAGKPHTVKVKRGEKEWTWSGTDWWQLWIDQADRANKDVLPILKRLNQTWAPSEFIEKSRGIQAKLPTKIDETTWSELVISLSDPDYQKRTHAAQSIQEFGLAAVPHLRRSVQDSELDPCTLKVLRLWLSDLQPATADSPMRIAMLMR